MQRWLDGYTYWLTTPHHLGGELLGIKRKIKEWGSICDLLVALNKIVLAIKI